MALYIHVPFCKTKCPYCDFNTYQGIERMMDPYMGAVTQEITQWGRVLEGAAVNSVFFGGGTPSYLNEGSIDRILESARSSFQLKDGAEITIEANPGDLDLPACQRLINAGVNRLSIGVQSLDNELLSLLGRRHDADQAMAALAIARSGGFSNINLDFMYGLPHQTMLQWQDTMQRMVSQHPDHISLYCLTLEEGTPLHRWVETGKLPQADEDLAAEEGDEVLVHLAEGFHHLVFQVGFLEGNEVAPASLDGGGLLQEEEEVDRDQQEAEGVAEEAEDLDRHVGGLRHACRRNGKGKRGGDDSGCFSHC